MKVYKDMETVNGYDDVLLVYDFLREGMEHGTVVEATYCALKSALSGEAKSVQEALRIGSGEWYK